MSTMVAAALLKSSINSSCMSGSSAIEKPSSMVRSLCPVWTYVTTDTVEGDILGARGDVVHAVDE